MLILLHVGKIPCKVNVQLSPPPPPPNWNDNVLLPPPSLLPRLFHSTSPSVFLVSHFLSQSPLRSTVPPEGQLQNRKRKSDIPDAGDSTSLSPSDPLPSHAPLSQPLILPLLIGMRRASHMHTRQDALFLAHIPHSTLGCLI